MMNRFSTHCWLACVLVFSAAGPIQWLMLGSGGTGRSHAGVWANNFGADINFGEGDFNADGVVDSADYSVWANNFGFSAYEGLVANHGIWANNFDNTNTIGPQWPAATYGYPGMMDAGDYTDWANHFGQSGDGMPGDFNADGTVDIVDKLEWDRYFGQIYTPPFASGAAAVRAADLTAAPVPEPSSFVLATLALLALAAFARMTRLRSK